MMQIAARTWCLAVSVSVGLWCCSNAPASDRTFFLLPRSADAAPVELPDHSTFASDAMGEYSTEGWAAYQRVWQAHAADPGAAEIRRFLGLPLSGTAQIEGKRGRSSQQSLRWSAGSYDQIDTPHFTIFSRADRKSSVGVAEDLERGYWVWTQMFFPLWSGRVQVTAALKDLQDGEDVTAYLKQKKTRLAAGRKMRVVLFENADQYRTTLKRHVPGIENSTGYYDNFRQTTYLYAGEDADVVTRRHELVHQMFRQATRGMLRNKMPAAESGFWLIEGIAGYFESLWFSEEGFATVGGWDSDRLQFARHRVLVSNDLMPLTELRADGFQSAQQRSDLPRWYAHAIARAHQLIDGGNPRHRLAIYRLLAQRYKITTDLTRIDVDDELKDADASLRDFLRVTDQRIHDHPALHPPGRLVLADCPISAAAVASIPASDGLKWLDLAGLPVDNAAVQRLVPNPSSLSQLRLERSRVDARLRPWLAQLTSVTELDLSSTRIDDETVASFPTSNLEYVWLTGAPVTDQCIDSIIKMKRLESIDLQLTDVSPQGLSRLRQARPQLQINTSQVQQVAAP